MENGKTTFERRIKKRMALAWKLPLPCYIVSKIDFKKHNDASIKDFFKTIFIKGCIFATLFSKKQLLKLGLELPLGSMALLSNKIICHS